MVSLIYCDSDQDSQSFMTNKWSDAKKKLLDQIFKINLIE